MTRSVRPPSTGQHGFVQRHALRSPEAAAAAEEVAALAGELSFVRVGFVDPHGILRSKVLTSDTFRSALRNGLDMSPGPMLFDTGHALVPEIFIDQAGLGVAELRGAGDFVAVPDPFTFRVLDTGYGRTGIVICDEYLRNGQPHPLSTRHALRRALDAAAGRSLHPIIGLELEWYLLRLSNEQDRGGVGGFGVQGAAPGVSSFNGGYQFNSDLLLADAMVVLAPLGMQIMDGLGLPLRTVEHESGPGQIEITFDPLPALEAADAAVLLRTFLKESCLRRGLLASFMAVPGLPGADPSGWHLHQSVENAAGRNLFVPEAGDPLSLQGAHYLAGLVDRAVETTALAVPTVTGYRRMNPLNSLSPDRLTWSQENRGALIRVLGGPGDPATHLENRLGEPAANPYLYVLSQVGAGLDGMKRNLQPHPEDHDPHAVSARALPIALAAAVSELRSSTFAQQLLGPALHELLCRLKESEWSRFSQSEAGRESVAGTTVSRWENDEYLMAF